ncbi:CHAD domain-containing protein [Chromatocurvus halotolerans]|uniref:CHAD domain-containing protein n=1 Tax=Chromatocurvus halotolerans TaxID=1132028 RepID=A0A4R2L9D8_9GAMM|nr:CHAD domain-containing protein [Chromatocurvus halotolerans]TCO75855.1 CHAD domain-containing protein [Chromatocurvus halotolerans]
MAYKFRIGESAGDGIRRMARQQIDKALDEIADGELDQHATVHQVRKRCKKVRALLRLARGDLDAAGKIYQRENVCFRDAARRLSNVRDAQAMLETCDKLKETVSSQSDLQHLRDLRDELEARMRNPSLREDDLDERLDAFAVTFREARIRVDAWPVGDGFGSLAPGLKKNYRQGRNAMRKAARKPGTAHFHDWRKRVKYHLYHIQVLAPSWKHVLKPWQDEIKRLGDDLGDEHDLAVFTQMLAQNPGDFCSRANHDALQELSRQRRTQLQIRTLSLGQRVFAEKPKPLTNRLRAYWAASLSGSA